MRFYIAKSRDNKELNKEEGETRDRKQKNEIQKTKGIRTGPERIQCQTPISSLSFFSDCLRYDYVKVKEKKRRTETKLDCGICSLHCTTLF